MNLHEVWSPITGYEGVYEISNLGRVKSLSRDIFSREGLKFIRTSKEKILTNSKDSYGYAIVALNGKTQTVHRLVAKAFIPTTIPGLQVNHKNMDRFDPRESNLEWVTCAENIRHSKTNRPFNRSRRFSDLEILGMYDLFVSGSTVTELEKKFNTSSTVILAYIHGHSSTALWQDYAMLGELKVRLSKMRRRGRYSHIPESAFKELWELGYSRGRISEILEVSWRYAHGKIFEMNKKYGSRVA